jgi:hypothetical protein
VLLLSQEAPPPPVQDLPRTDSGSLLDPLHGTLAVKYRFRATPSENDTDFYELVTLSYGDPTKDVITASLSARFAEDVDGNRNVSGYYPFTSLDDGTRSFASQRLYTAYVEAHPAGTGFTARAGRQTLDFFPEAVPMDGASLRYQAGADVILAVFGGIPMNLFETSPRGDSMYGASIDWLPDPTLHGRYRIEYLHVGDENLFGMHQNDLLGFSVDEGDGPFNFHARYTMLEGTSRDVVARFRGAVPDADFVFDFQGTYVFEQIQALSYVLDPYASFMMDLEPYLDLVARASKSIGQEFTLDASFTSRQLTRSGSETTYNHSFKRYEVGLRFRNWPFQDVSIGASADFWNSSADHFWTAGGDVSWTPHRDVVLSVGTSYALYTIDVFTGGEQSHVRLYYASLKLKVARGSSFDARFTLEVNSIDTFRTFEFGFYHVF